MNWVFSVNGKERIRCALAGERADRLPRADAPWKETIARWRREGLPSETHWSDYFEMDIRHALFLDATFRLPEQLLERDNGVEVVSTPDGATVKRFLQTSGADMPLTYPVGSARQWYELSANLQPTVQRFSLGRYGDYLLDHTGCASLEQLRQDWLRVAETNGTYIMLMTHGPYESLLPKCGDETLLLAMAMGDEWVADAFHTIAQMLCDSCQMLFDEGIKPDGVFLGEDMAYKSGPLFSPDMYRAILEPAHRMMVDFFRQNQCDVFLHSDGDCRALMPLLMDVGIDALNPLESRAGMDLEEILQTFPALTAMGGISVECMQADDVSLLDDELDRKLSVGWDTNRFIYHSDHSVPPDVSFERYNYVVGRLNESPSTTGRTSQAKGTR